MGRANAVTIRFAVAKLLAPENAPSHERVAGPATIILRDRICLVENATQLVTQKRKKAKSPIRKSPRTAYTYQSTEPSLRNTESESTHSTNSIHQTASDTHIDEIPPTGRYEEEPLFSRENHRADLGANANSTNRPKPHR